MGKYFHFDRIIEKYSMDCQLLQEASPEAGEWIAGNWIPGTAPPPETIRGAVIPMSDRKVYQSGGAFTEQDREFITKSLIPADRACYIIHQGSRYKVESSTDYSGYARFYDYNLKRVDAFDRTVKD